MNPRCRTKREREFQPIRIKLYSADILENRGLRTPPYAARAGARIPATKQIPVLRGRHGIGIQYYDVGTYTRGRSRAAGLAASTRLKFYSPAHEVLNQLRVTELITRRSPARCRPNHKCSRRMEKNVVRFLVTDSTQDVIHYEYDHTMASFIQLLQVFYTMHQAFDYVVHFLPLISKHGCTLCIWHQFVRSRLYNGNSCILCSIQLNIRIFYHWSCLHNPNGGEL